VHGESRNGDDPVSPRHGPTTPSDTWPGLLASPQPPGPGRSPGWPVPAVEHQPPVRSAGVRWFAGGALAAVALVLAIAGVLAATGDGYRPLGAGDLTLTVVPVTTTCVPGAGCDVTYRVEATWPPRLDPALTYRVTYEIEGATGPIRRSLEVHGRSYSGPDQGAAQTRTADDELTARVIEVSRT
jgi:hypothetical protein